MFGEKDMYGTSIHNVDSKGRLIVPNFTGVEASEELLLVQEDGCLALYSKEEYSRFIEKCLEEVDHMTSVEDLISFKTELERTLCKRVIKNIKTDPQHRITASKYLEPNTKYRVIGCRKHIILEQQEKKVK